LKEDEMRRITTVMTLTVTVIGEVGDAVSTLLPLMRQAHDLNDVIKTGLKDKGNEASLEIRSLSITTEEPTSKPDKMW
jgi:hypothetical protein